jgi:hypothetical protein
MKPGHFFGVVACITAISFSKQNVGLGAIFLPFLVSTLHPHWDMNPGQIFFLEVVPFVRVISSLTQTPLVFVSFSGLKE